jgi:hypothetical protein
MRTTLFLTLIALVLFAAPARAGKVFLTKEEALKLAFKDCEVTRTTIVLDPAQQKQISKLCGTTFERRLAFRYVATQQGKLVGTAYFDVHRVRTLRETLMIVVDPENHISRLEVLSFGEPIEYMPRVGWYAQFKGKGLDATLSLKKGIKKVTGATMTAKATTSAARRVLALHKVCTAATETPKPKPVKPGPKKPKQGKQGKNVGGTGHPE